MLDLNQETENSNIQTMAKETNLTAIKTVT